MGYGVAPQGTVASLANGGGVNLLASEWPKESQVSSEQQQHPLHSRDRPVVERLLQTRSPREQDLVDSARLLQRYHNFPGAEDIQRDLRKVLKTWGLNQTSLYQRTRAIWAKGFRPNMGGDDGPVGSGFDSSSDAANSP